MAGPRHQCLFWRQAWLAYAGFQQTLSFFKSGLPLRYISSLWFAAAVDTLLVPLCTDSTRLVILLLRLLSVGWEPPPDPYSWLWWQCDGLLVLCAYPDDIQWHFSVGHQQKSVPWMSFLQLPSSSTPCSSVIHISYLSIGGFNCMAIGKDVIARILWAGLWRLVLAPSMRWQISLIVFRSACCCPDHGNDHVISPALGCHPLNTS